MAPVKWESGLSWVSYRLGVLTMRVPMLVSSCKCIQLEKLYSPPRNISSTAGLWYTFTEKVVLSLLVFVQNLYIGTFWPIHKISISRTVNQALFMNLMFGGEKVVYTVLDLDFLGHLLNLLNSCRIILRIFLSHYTFFFNSFRSVLLFDAALYSFFIFWEMVCLASCPIFYIYMKIQLSLVLNYASEVMSSFQLWFELWWMTSCENTFLSLFWNVSTFRNSKTDDNGLWGF